MYTKEQIMEQTCRYLQQERSCVTARWICRNFGVSRATASSVLCDVLDPSKNIFKNINDEFLSFFSGNTLFEVTIMKEENSSDEDGSKKVRLVKERINNPREFKVTEGTIYSVAIVDNLSFLAPSAVTVQCAHEQDMFYMREEALKKSCTAYLDNSNNEKEIIKDKRLGLLDCKILEAATSPAEIAILPINNKPTSKRKRRTTTTTAASFFASKAVANKVTKTTDSSSFPSNLSNHTY